MTFRIIKDSHLDTLVVDDKEALFNHDVRIRGDLIVDGCISSSHTVEISQTDFGASGYVIATPGIYRFCEDIVYDASVSGVPAITVNAIDGVIIDLGGRSLQQSPSSFATHDDISAIIVNSGANDITIKNGRISGFSDQGIILLSDNVGQTTDHRNIVIEKLVFESLGKITTQSSLMFGTRGAVVIYGTTNLLVRDCTASNVSSQFDTEVFVSYFTDSIVFENLEARDNASDIDGGFTQGIGHTFFANAVNINCKAFRNTGSVVIGNGPYIGNNYKLLGGEYNDNFTGYSTVVAGFCIGIGIAEVFGYEVRDVAAMRNSSQGEVSGDVNYTAGLQVFMGSSGKLLNCTSMYNQSTSNGALTRTAAAGYEINTSQNCHIENCISDTPISGSPYRGMSMGFEIDDSNNVTIVNCVAKGGDVIVPTSLANAKIVGFYASIIPDGGKIRNIAFRECKAIKGSSDDPNVTVAGFIIGENFDTIFGLTEVSNAIIDDCIVEDYHNSADPSRGFGILLGDTTLNSSVTNCKVNNCDIGIAIIGTNSSSNIIQSNRVIGSSLYGFQDTTANSNMISMNYAYNPNASSNYTGLPLGTPVRTWVIGAAPNPVDNNGIIDPLDNFSITN